MNTDTKNPAGERRPVAPAGDIFVLDSGRTREIAWTKHRGLQLFMRRKGAEGIFGAAILPPTALATRLTASCLAPLLRAQMNLLAAHVGRLDDADRSSMLQSTIDLTIAALRGIAGSKSYMEAQSSRNLLAAALRFIEANLSDQSLGPTTLATALGCSRATIYRAFSENELTVAGVIRETRLKRARGMIEALPQQVTISDIAMRCGFFDASNFSRSFRARFGISPTDIRRRP
jgi:AraC family transcriptional activator of tynA and feaB